MDTDLLLPTAHSNAPQFFFSIMYFIYNNVFTSMHLAHEWAGYATHRKPLKVSQPAPGQRSSYWLNLPWSYSLPLLAQSVLLHWLVSRSLYLVSVKQIYTARGNYSSVTIGYSILMMLFVMAVVLLMSAVIFGFSRRELSSAAPLLGSRSLALSAVCHHPNDPKTEACKPLQWGVTKRSENGQPGHCALSSGISNTSVDDV